MVTAGLPTFVTLTRKVAAPSDRITASPTIVIPEAALSVIPLSGPVAAFTIIKSNDVLGSGLVNPPTILAAVSVFLVLSVVAGEVWEL